MVDLKHLHDFFAGVNQEIFHNKGSLLKRTSLELLSSCRLHSFFSLLLFYFRLIFRFISYIDAFLMV